MKEINTLNTKNKTSFFKSKRNKIIIASIFVLLALFFIFSKKKPDYKFVTVEKGSIEEVVSVTGNTVPEESVSLAFGSTGIVSRTLASVGQEVKKGMVLAELNMNDLLAQLKNAQAGLTIANQQALSLTTSIENITAEQDAVVASARQAMYSNFTAVPTDDSNSYTAPIISGSYSGLEDGTYTIKVYASRTDTGASIKYTGLESGSGPVMTVSDVPLGTHGLFIRFPSDVNSSNYINTTWIVDVPNKRWSGYTSALKNYQTALESRDRVIADAKSGAGAVGTSNISDAKVMQAQANVDGVLARIKDARIIAPISGMITQFDAKVGQLASPSIPLVSMISNNGYEVHTGVSEIDVSKVLVGDKVSMTLDAFPNEVFGGEVFYVAPSETNNQGVVSYKVKISFDQKDDRLKSGLTANIDIKTNTKDNVLILPQYAILQNDKGSFVKVLDGDEIKEKPVVLGIQDQEGNVEVISGVTEGEKVLNIGLKN